MISFSSVPRPIPSLVLLEYCDNVVVMMRQVLIVRASSTSSYLEFLIKWDVLSAAHRKYHGVKGRDKYMDHISQVKVSLVLNTFEDVLIVHSDFLLLFFRNDKSF